MLTTAPELMQSHNKSGNPNLSLLNMDDPTLENHYNTLITHNITVTTGTIEDSDCHFHGAKDGRFSVGSKKICFGYQLIAWKKFGRDALNAVPSNKTKPEHLVISHLCGKGPRCCNPAHLVLEQKRINDERTHCHFCIQNILSCADHQGVKIALHLGLCPHTPTCCTTSLW